MRAPGLLRNHYVRGLQGVLRVSTGEVRRGGTALGRTGRQSIQYRSRAETGREQEHGGQD